MNTILIKYENYLTTACISEQTSYSYFNNAKEYVIWYESSFGLTFEKLLRQNLLEYIQYLKKIKKYKGKQLSAKTTNQKLSSLKKFNEFLVDFGVQKELIIQKNDYMKIQANFSNPSTIDRQDLEKFKQRILLSKSSTNLRLYTIVIMLEKTGLRIGELLNIKVADIIIESGELIVRNGKGKKQRIVYLNSKVIDAIKEQLKLIEQDSEFLFPSRQSRSLTRTVVNKEFKKLSSNITPHALRHFFCTNALEQGFGIHEVASLAGHNSAKTTLIYLNPSKKQMKDKMELL